VRKSVFIFIAAGAGLLSPGLRAQEARTNAFNDPFVQVTSALKPCPVPEGPLYTAQEVREVAHVRAQHGGSCYRVGRCRLANSYLYDAEIIPRVAQYLQLDGRFDDTTLWLQGERRIVLLMGCVKTREQSEAMEKAVWLVDDVMGVVNYLRVGDEPLRYVAAKP
jgi:BON domain